MPNKTTTATSRAKRATAAASRHGEWAILFAHGAGAGSASPWMKRWKKRLATIGPVATFDYPYMRDGRKSPDRQEKLVEAHRLELAKLRRKHPDRRVLLVGKSMGSRIGCHVANDERVDALVCLGYPLVSPSDASKLRDEVLLSLRTPILFVQGTRDPLAPLALLEKTLARMKAPHALHVVESGNHSLEITAKHARESGSSQDAVEQAISARIELFLTDL
jgi:predicted alpha/beta-hydrolase family hydrolase